jgi:endo-1,4-beta-xylanase
VTGKLTRREFACMAAAAGFGATLHSEVRDPSVPAKPHCDGPDSLRAHAAAVGLQIGCAVVPQLLDVSPLSPSASQSGLSQDPYTHTVVEQAGILVAENAMKWSSLRPSPANFDFDASDKLFDFASRHTQLIRGHNLCWHQQLPSWFASYATKANARALLTQHIQSVAGRYAGRVHSWDVVNEAIHLPDGRADSLRNSPWLELIGPEYIELAFTTAAKVDPQAKLTYNDYDIELDTAEQSAKRGAILLLVRRMHARGIPIHAIGIQSHLQATGPRPGAGLLSLIREAAKMGLEVYITEMDVNTHALEGDAKAQDTAVAEVYKSYLDLVLPEPNVKALLTWGVTDAHSWLNQSRQPWALRPDGARQRPLPFDDQYEPTPAFFAMRAAMDSARQPIVPADITAPPQDTKDPYAPFAVPGSPGAPPQQ